MDTTEAVSDKIVNVVVEVAYDDNIVNRPLRRYHTDMELSDASEAYIVYPLVTNDTRLVNFSQRNRKIINAIWSNVPGVEAVAVSRYTVEIRVGLAFYATAVEEPLLQVLRDLFSAELDVSYSRPSLLNSTSSAESDFESDDESELEMNDGSDVIAEQPWSDVHPDGSGLRNPNDLL